MIPVTWIPHPLLIERSPKPRKGQKQPLVYTAHTLFRNQNEPFPKLRKNDPQEEMMTSGQWPGYASQKQRN